MPLCSDCRAILLATSTHRKINVKLPFYIEVGIKKKHKSKQKLFPRQISDLNQANSQSSLIFYKSLIVTPCVMENIFGKYIFHTSVVEVIFLLYAKPNFCNHFVLINILPVVQSQIRLL